MKIEDKVLEIKVQKLFKKKMNDAKLKLNEINEAGKLSFVARDGWIK